jgi:DNA-binding NtrC family response regulator
MQYSILIVEDNVDHLELIKLALRRSKDPFNIHHVKYGAECIKLCKERAFDIIVLDYNLPDSSGLEVFRLLRQKKIYIPVVVVTGYGNERIAVEFMKIGASDYLVKDTTYLRELPIILSRILTKNNLKFKNPNTPTILKMELPL